MYKIHTNCRACGYGPPIVAEGVKASMGGGTLLSVLNLGFMPLPNAFRKAGEMIPGNYPVELMVCPKCNLGQLSAVVDPAVLYSNYPYVTSPSETMRKHFCALWESLNEERKAHTVVEIGSNDGLFLSFCKEQGVKHLMGIDPAENLVKISRDRGIVTQCSLFNRDTANTAVSSLPKIDLVVARHVFCHVDDWREFITNVSVMASKDTLICLEVPYAKDTIDYVEWDQIYAEHLSYLTITSIEKLLENTPLRLHHIIKFPVHGGAVAVLLRRVDSSHPQKGSVATFLASERTLMSDWIDFAQKARDKITAMKLMVRGLREDGKRVAGYGASAKATVWINACGFTKDDIYGVYDYTVQKLYTKIPGTNIPVIHEGAFYADNPDYAVVWAWNFLPEIMERQKKWTSGGGKFITPVPFVRIL